MKVNIPNPCTEKYDNMSPTELGRMCKICNTEVVDFTYWETKDIVDYIQKSNQKVCGRINLQNPIAKASKKMNWNRYLAAALAIVTLGAYSTIKAASIPLFKSSKVYCISDSVTMQVVDSNNKPIEGVYIRNNNNTQKYHTNKNGIVMLPIIENDDYTISYIGYQQKKIKINKKNSKNILKIILEEDLYEIGEIIVEPLERINLKNQQKFILNKRLVQQNQNSTSNKSISLGYKLTRLFNIFSVRDED